MGSEAASEPWQDGLALVCEQGDRIRADLGASGGLVDRVVASARAGHDVKDPLDALHQAIMATGDVLGVYGHAARHHGPAVAGIHRAADTRPDPGVLRGAGTTGGHQAAGTRAGVG
ncbi:hypothetical protein ACFQYP_12770 [Nonomuraea antimicrobica]